MQYMNDKSPDQSRHLLSLIMVSAHQCILQYVLIPLEDTRGHDQTVLVSKQIRTLVWYHDKKGNS